MTKIGVLVSHTLSLALKQTKPYVTAPARAGYIPLYQPGETAPHPFGAIGQLARYIPAAPMNRTQIGGLANTPASLNGDDVYRALRVSSSIVV